MVKDSFLTWHWGIVMRSLNHCKLKTSVKMFTYLNLYIFLFQKWICREACRNSSNFVGPWPCMGSATSVSRSVVGNLHILHSNLVVYNIHIMNCYYSCTGFNIGLVCDRSYIKLVQVAVDDRGKRRSFSIQEQWLVGDLSWNICQLFVLIWIKLLCPYLLTLMNSRLMIVWPKTIVCEILSNFAPPFENTQGRHMW